MLKKRETRSSQGCHFNGTYISETLINWVTECRRKGNRNLEFGNGGLRDYLAVIVGA
jgi:hypothetical protein